MEHKFITDTSDASDLFTANLKVAEGTVLNIENETKAKIMLAVKTYIELCPKEYDACISQINRKRWMQEDNFSSIDGGNNIVQRALFEIPDNLFQIIVKGLEVDEIKQFKGKKGSRWFAKQYPEFRVSKSL